MSQIITNCPHCGQQINTCTEWAGQNLECPICKKNFIAPGNYGYGMQKAPGNALGICALVFSVLFAIVGLILSIIGLTKYPAGTGGKTMSIIALVISLVNMVLGFLVFG